MKGNEGGRGLIWEEGVERGGGGAVKVQGTVEV